jgi:hypothetical protein
MSLQYLPYLHAVKDIFQRLLRSTEISYRVRELEFVPTLVDPRSNSF